MGGQYLEPCIANPFDPPAFAACGDPPNATPPAWLVTRTIIKYVVIGCIIVATVAISFILMRGVFPTRPGYSSAPAYPPPSPPTPPVTSKSDSPTGPQTANPHGHGTPMFTY